MAYLAKPVSIKSTTNQVKLFKLASRWISVSRYFHFWKKLSLPLSTLVPILFRFPS